MASEKGMTPASKPILAIRNDLEAYKEQIRIALPMTAKKYLTPERVAKVALLAIGKNPTLMTCTRESILQAIMDTASLGLEVGGALGHAYLVPYKNKGGGYRAQAIIGYRGYISLARRSGTISSVAANVVYKKDTFEIDLGSGEPPVHKPYLDGNRGDPKLVYAVARFKDGAVHTEFMTMDQVDQIRERSQARNNGPWVTDYLEMARKTVIRRAAKYWPISIEMADAMEMDNRADSGGFANNAGMIVTADPESGPIPTTDEVLHQLQSGDDRKNKGRSAQKSKDAIQKEEPVVLSWLGQLHKEAETAGMKLDYWKAAMETFGIDPADADKVSPEDRRDLIQAVEDWIAQQTVGGS